MAHDVFISHSTKDKAVSDAVCAALENAGIRCWIAPRDVQPGRSFAGEITRAIQQSKVMVLIFSAHSNNSDQILREVQLATNSHLHIIQFRIEDALLNDDLAYFLSTPHWLDALSPPLENHIERLETSIRALLGAPEQDTAPPVAKSEAQPSVQLSVEPVGRTIARGPQIAPRTTKTRLWIGGGVIAALLAAGLVFASMFWKPAEDKGTQKAETGNADKLSGSGRTPAPSKDPAAATKQEPYENSLGMKFVPVAAANVLFSVWETRVKDYKLFVEATKREWPKPSFQQTEEHPAVNVSWEDATAFCEWLSEQERTAGRISAKQSYRLPSDEEWSAAVGLEKEGGTTPKERDEKVKGVYPWGTKWPPPNGAGNYDPSLKVDEYGETSPVGSFETNRYGIHDLGGNVWEWCQDWYDAEKESRVLRGASWVNHEPDLLLSSFRVHCTRGCRSKVYGFRCVMVVESSR